MVPSTIFFNPRARVYNLRFLLLTAIASTALLAYNRVLWRHNESSVPLWLSMFFCLFILVHHLAVLFRWPGSCLAVIDLAMTTFEISVTGNIAYYIYDNPELVLDTPVPVICLLIPLVLSAVFRAVTFYSSEGRICSQQFEFLGGCALVDPAYTPWTIAFIWARPGEDSSASAEKGEAGDVGTQPTSPTCDAVERGAYDDPQGTVSEKAPLLAIS